MRLRLAFLAAFFFLFTASALAASYPDALAEVVELYPGATVAMSMETGEGSHVILQTKDAADKVAGWYADHFKRAGWKLEAKVEAGETITLSYSQEGSDAGISISVTPDQGMTMISVIAVSR